MCQEKTFGAPIIVLRWETPSDAHFGVKDIGWQALAPAVACTALSTSIVAIRWYTRCRLARCLGLDDHVILLSVALSWAMTTIIGLEVHHGIGVYDQDIPAATVAKLVVVNNDLWIVLVNITKLSILIQYLRVFSSPYLRKICVLLMVFLLPAVIWGIFGGTFLCSPTEKLWKPSLPGRCMNAQAYWYSVAGIDIGLDFLVLLLPIPAVSSLRMPRRQKIGLLLVFLLGFFVCAVSVVRLLSVLITSLDGDYVASGVWAVVWSAVEANVGIVCACLLSLKPLITKLFPQLVEETQPPRHSMHLAMIETGIWPGDLDHARLTMPIASMARSKRSSEGKQSNSARMSSQHSSEPISSRQSLWNQVRLSQVEHIKSMEAEDTSSSGRARERMSLFDILQEDADIARARVQRRDSTFRGHI